MSNSSDEDAFASADEDNIPMEVKSAKVDSNPKNRKSSEISEKILEAICDSEGKTPVAQPEQEKTKPKGVRKLERPARNDSKPKPSKLGVKVEKSDQILPAKTELPFKQRTEPTPPLRTECWEYSSWEEAKKELQSKTSSSKSSEIGDWESDDWEKPTDSDTEHLAGKNLYGVFPKAEIKSSEHVPHSSASQKEEDDLSSVLDKLTERGGHKNQQWSSWKPWGGFTSLLSTASEGVATLTSHVSQGLSTVIESGMGVPDPAEMARQDQEEEAKRKSDQASNASSSKESESTDSQSRNSLSLGNFVTGVTQISNKVVSGGLDALEGIGKKTMNILQENDPGLLNKRKFLGMESEQPVLSQILREAKEKTEESERNMKHMKKHLYKKQLHFETLFDDYCGLVHLEALEMLSRQSTLKLESLMTPLSGKALKELQETMAEVKELCELPDIDDESDGSHTSKELDSKFVTAFEDLELKMDFKEVTEIWRKDNEYLNGDDPKTAQEIHDKAFHSLAQTTAVSVNKMHKLAELLLIQEHHSTVNEADSLVQLTTVICWHLGGIATRFGNFLSDEQNFQKSGQEDVDALITSICLEGSNSTSYIQNAFQLFIPILQIGAA